MFSTSSYSEATLAGAGSGAVQPTTSVGGLHVMCTGTTTGSGFGNGFSNSTTSALASTILGAMTSSLFILFYSAPSSGPLATKSLRSSVMNLACVYSLFTSLRPYDVSLSRSNIPTEALTNLLFFIIFNEYI